MLILASKSPRRTEILDLLQLEHRCVPSNVSENIDGICDISAVAETLAVRKAQDIFLKNNEDTVIGADTIVTVDNEILGKPKDIADAKRMLRLLSGKTHIVYTGVSVINKEKSVSFTSENYVTFYSLSEKEIEEYIISGEPMDKAGAYAIQGIGAKFVKSLNGDFFAVMGLPAARLYNELKTFNYLEDC